ncbi:MAG: dihydroorotase [Actinomycetia bacterium]|nr:dihydroorotase [Actinomycetes bacterium]
MTVLIQGGTIIDATGERAADVLVSDDGTIIEVGPDLRGDTVLDATGCVVSPGFVDLHTHLREPGGEDAETIESGARAAAKGGFTAVVAMPNTDPTVDHAAVVAEVLERGRTAPCDVHTSGAITVGRRGDDLAPMGEMIALGVRIFTDDGNGVQDDRLMRRALEYASSLRAPSDGGPIVLAQHCEVTSLSAGGHMHEGEWSSRLGVGGQPAEAEELMVMRDIALSQLTGSRVHFQHLSTAGSVAMVRAAKAGGLPITAEAAPHHFSLTHEACATYDTRFKVHPPLRTTSDVEAVRQGLADGTIDAIATDHAPHVVETKERPFDQAPPGMIGLETALAVALTELDMPLADIVGALSWRPAAIAGLDAHGGPVETLRPANLTVFDPEARWKVPERGWASRSNNSPFVGRELRGQVRHTVLHGEPVVIQGEAQR